MTINRFPRTLALAFWSLPILAHAHPGHGPQGLSAGLVHPLTGLDHLLVMIAVGLWAVQLGGRALWLVPLSFVSLMAVGGSLGMAGATVPGVEQGILSSVFLSGLLLLSAWRLPLWASMALTGLFALFHGVAHGNEMPMGAAGLTYGAGMLFSTVLLHAVGVAGGLVLRSASQSAWLRVAGAGVLVGATILAFH